MISSITLPGNLKVACTSNYIFYYWLSWITGLLFGGILVIGGEEVFLSWMRRADLEPVSIVCLFASVYFPFLLSALAVLLSCSWLQCLLCFFKAALVSFSVCGVWRVCAGAGWLVCPLLFFSQILTLPLLFLFSGRRFHGARSSLRELGLFAGLCFFITSVDRCLVSPFLALLAE